MNDPHRTIRVREGDFFLPRDAVCVLLDVEHSTLQGWMKSVDPPPYNREQKGFPARELGHWIRKRQTLRKGQGGSRPYLPDGVVIVDTPSVSGGLPSALPAKKDYNAERTRKEAAQADKIEMENAVARGELVLAADVEKGWTDILSRVKTRMMQVPYTCAMVTAGMTDMTQIQEVIRGAVRDALMEMSADWRQTTSEDED